MDTLWPAVAYVLDGPVFPILYLGHALYVFNSYKPLLSKKPWLLSLVCCMVHLVFGGAVRASLLGLQSQFLSNNVVMPTIIAFWFITWYCPGDFVLVMYRSGPIKIVGKVVEQLYKARAITHAIHETLHHLDSPSIFSVILFGTLGGCAGSYWKSIVMRTVLNEQPPTEMSVLSPGTKLSFYVSIFYYVTTNPENYWWGPILSHEIALAAVMVYLSLYAVITGFVEESYIPPPFNFIEQGWALLVSPFSAQNGSSSSKPVDKTHGTNGKGDKQNKRPSQGKKDK